jgi:hypothetical protein
LWEDSGGVIGHKQIILGLNHADFGVAGQLQIGTDPLLFIMRVPNVHLKLKLIDGPRVQAAVGLGAYFILPYASDAFFSTAYASRLEIKSLTYAFPASFSVSARLTDWLVLHDTTTVLLTTGGDFDTTWTPGNFLTAELRAFKHHGVYVHAGQVGLWDHKFAVFGVSYRYHASWLELRAGYFYRQSPDGLQGQPMVDVSFFL